MQRLTKLIVRVGAFAFAAAALLSACQVEVVERPRPGPGPAPDVGYCTREYAPVCARRGQNYETFNNSCLAEEAGFRIVNAGECRAAPPSCPKEYNPVCASRGNDTRTFASSCRAEESGFRVIYPGRCTGEDGGGEGPAPGGSGICTKEYKPVCAKNGQRIETFPNQCEADVAGYRVVADGPCMTRTAARFPGRPLRRPEHRTEKCEAVFRSDAETKR